MSIRIAALRPFVGGMGHELSLLAREAAAGACPGERLGDTLRREYAEERARREPTLTPSVRESVRGILMRSAPMGGAVIPIGAIAPETGGAVSLDTLVTQIADWLRAEGLKVSIVRSPGPGSFRVTSIAVSWTPEPEAPRFNSVA